MNLNGFNPITTGQPLPFVGSCRPSIRKTLPMRLNPIAPGSGPAEPFDKVNTVKARALSCSETSSFAPKASFPTKKREAWGRILSGLPLKLDQSPSTESEEQDVEIFSDSEPPPVAHIETEKAPAVSERELVKFPAIKGVTAKTNHVFAVTANPGSSIVLEDF